MPKDNLIAMGPGEVKMVMRDLAMRHPNSGQFIRVNKTKNKDEETTYTSVLTPSGVAMIAQAFADLIGNSQKTLIVGGKRFNDLETEKSTEELDNLIIDVVFRQHAKECLNITSNQTALHHALNKLK